MLLSKFHVQKKKQTILKSEGLKIEFMTIAVPLLKRKSPKKINKK